MRRLIIGLAAAGLLSAGAVAQDRDGMRGPRGGFGGEFRGGMDRPRMGMMGPFSPEDMEAFADARIAALHAGLKLSADQERLWPSVEEAIRGLVKLRRDQARAFRERREAGGRGEARDDLPGMLRAMADRQGARAEAIRKLADAAAPLYATFDEGQKRRLRILTRHIRPGGMMRHAWRGRMGGPERDGMGRDGRMGRGGDMDE
jgi:zinc resistance-associated protein